MDALITYQEGMDSLSDNEYLQCINMIGRKAMSQTMFNGLYQQMHNNKMSTISRISGIIKQIKDMREDNNDVMHSHEKTQIDDIPSALLSEISSFLSFNDKIQFEQCNRSLFIGVRYCTLPLYHLSDKYFTKLINYCGDNKNDKYVSAIKIFKSLTININLLNVEMDENYEYHFNHKIHLQLFDHINSLEITNEKDIGVDEWTSEQDLELILEHLFSEQATNLPNIETLRFITNKIVSLDHDWLFTLNRFENHALKYVEISVPLMYDHIDPNFDESSLKWASNLKGIAVNNTSGIKNHITANHSQNHMMNIIYKLLTNKLESLHCGIINITNNFKMCARELKEICLPWKYYKFNIDLLLTQNMHKLERVYFRDVGLYILTDKENESMELLLNKIINIYSVKYIGLDIFIDSDHKFDLRIIDILINGIKNMNRSNTLKIRINKLQLFKTDEPIVGKLIQLVNVLNSNCANWMLIMNDCRTIELDNKLIQNLIQNLLKSTNKYKVMYCSKDIRFCVDNCALVFEKCFCVDNYAVSNNFVITNENCCIDGYYETWIMECQCCKQYNIFG
eukprot:79445_1